MLTSKQRAYLRGLANSADAILQIGKGGIGENLIRQVDDALTAREIVKLRCLETADVTPRQAANLLAEATGADVVQTIGTRFILYRPAPEKPVIVLPQ